MLRVLPKLFILVFFSKIINGFPQIPFGFPFGPPSQMTYPNDGVKSSGFQTSYSSSNSWGDPSGTVNFDFSSLPIPQAPPLPNPWMYMSLGQSSYMPGFGQSQSQQNENQNQNQNTDENNEYVRADYANPTQSPFKKEYILNIPTEITTTTTTTPAPNYDQENANGYQNSNQESQPETQQPENSANTEEGVSEVNTEGTEGTEENGEKNSNPQAVSYDSKQDSQYSATATNSQAHASQGGENMNGNSKNVGKNGNINIGITFVNGNSNKLKGNKKKGGKLGQGQVKKPKRKIRKRRPTSMYDDYADPDENDEDTLDEGEGDVQGQDQGQGQDLGQVYVNNGENPDNMNYQ